MSTTTRTPSPSSTPSPVPRAGASTKARAGGGRSRRPGPARATVLGALAAVCVVLAAAAAWTALGALSATPDDRAHIDGPATERVSEDIAAGVAAVLSYDHADLGRTSRAAERVLAGDALRRHRASFTEIERAAQRPGHRDLVRSTTVRSVGVRTLTGGRAEALVLADRRDLDERMRPRSSSVVWVEVVAVRSAGAWRITEMTPV